MVCNVQGVPGIGQGSEDTEPQTLSVRPLQRSPEPPSPEARAQHLLAALRSFWLMSGQQSTIRDN